MKSIQAAAMAAAMAAGAGRLLAGEMDDLFSKLGADNLGERKKARDRFESLVLAAGRPKAESERAAASKAICALLDKEMSDDTRCWLLREQWLIGGDESVPTLVTHLDHKGTDVADAARRALQKNASPAATTALVGALDRAKTTDWKVACLLALGGRGDEKAVSAVMKHLADQEVPVVSAAAAALGQIGGRDAAKALASARSKGSAEQKAIVNDRYLEVAERYLREGKHSEALAIYKELDKSTETELVRVAARQGQLAVELSKKAGVGHLVYPEVKG